MRCGTCGSMVTAEHKINRFGSKYSYYHCTWRTSPRCPERSIRAEVLEEQLTAFLRSVRISAADHEQRVADLTRKAAEKKTDMAGVLATLDEQLYAIASQTEELTNLRLRKLVDDADFLARRNALDMERASIAERKREVATMTQWFEPAVLLLSFNQRAVEWFGRGTVDTKRLILRTLGSNLKLSDRKLSIDARSPFEFGVNEPMSPYWSEWCEYVRTRFEHRDPELLAIIANIYRIKAMVENESNS
jgi:hypothetical protein